METTTTINDDWNDYDKSVAECHLFNYGKIYLDEYGYPIDNDAEVEKLAEAEV